MNIRYLEVHHTSPNTFCQWVVDASLFWWIVNNQHDCAYSSRVVFGVRTYVVLFTKDSTIEKASDYLDMMEKGVLTCKTIDLSQASINRPTFETSIGTSTGVNLEKKSSDKELSWDLPSQPSLF